MTESINFYLWQINIQKCFINKINIVDEQFVIICADDLVLVICEWKSGL